MSSHRVAVRTEVKNVKVTIGRASTVHAGSATIGYNAHDEAVTRTVHGTECGTDVRRGRRSTFTITADRHEVDCTRCLKARA